MITASAISRAAAMMAGAAVTNCPLLSTNGRSDSLATFGTRDGCSSVCRSAALTLAGGPSARAPRCPESMSAVLMTMTRWPASPKAAPRLAATIARVSSVPGETTSTTWREPGSGTRYGSRTGAAHPPASANGSAFGTESAKASKRIDMRSMRKASAEDEAGSSATCRTAPRLSPPHFAVVSGSRPPPGGGRPPRPQRACARCGRGTRGSRRSAPPGGPRRARRQDRAPSCWRTSRPCGRSPACGWCAGRRVGSR